jgi:two-component system, NarL family, response regulator LiaR
LAYVVDGGELNARAWDCSCGSGWRSTTLGIAPRELDILELIAAGLSNKEIAERVHVSGNTVKTHSSRVFDKLGTRLRTQAVQLGKELRFIP